MLQRLIIAACILTLPSSVLAIECGDWYTVKKGDSLSRIAQAAFDDANKYDILHQANLDVIGPDPTVIVADQRLMIPCDPDLATNAPGDWKVQVTPAELKALSVVQNVQILDIRSSKALADGVIPTAVSIPFSEWRGPKDNPGAPPSAERLSQVIGAAGIRLNRPIVIVHSKPDAFDSGRAAYVYWLLKSAGADQLAILQGGHAAWTNANLPVDPEPRTAEAYVPDLSITRDWWADREEVSRIADGRQPGALLDARPSKFFRKLDKLGEYLPSTLPYAKNTPAPAAYQAASDPDAGVLKLLSQLKDQDINWEAETVVSFCNTGELGALNWFYASEVSQIENVKLYPESTKGWTGSGLDLAPAVDDILLD